MSRRLPIHLCLLALSTLLAASCQESEPTYPASTDQATELRDDGPAVGSFPSDGFRGPAVRIGDGIAWTWVKFDEAGEPASVGVSLSERALEGLPAQDASYVLYFHPRAEATRFQHVLLDYNPHGHDPDGVYDLEHFDIHFYMISNDERLAIQPDDPGFDLDPGPQYLPDMYLKANCVPQMGCHWVDLLAPEFNGGTFTRTYIWGTFNGAVIFFEPMITVECMRSTQRETLDLRQPPAYQVSGYYPDSYTLAHLDRPGRYNISLDNLSYHEAR